MKPLRILVLIGLIFMISGCAENSLAITEGTYDVTKNANWKNIDVNYNTDAGINLISSYSNWKKETDLEFLVEEPAALKYGTLILGNNQQAFDFAITQKNNFIDSLYLDRNGDGQIGADEALELKLQQKYNGNGYESYYSYVDDFPVYVPYRKADGTIVSKTIHLWMGFFKYDFHSRNNQDAPSVLMFHEVMSYLSGEVSITYRNQAKKVKFVLIDGDNNANFNDYGSDYLIVDKNYDGVYNFSREKQKLLELFETTVKESGEKINKTLRLSLFAYPEKIIVTDVNAEAPEDELLEPLEDDDWEADNQNKELLDLLKNFIDKSKE